MSKLKLFLKKSILASIVAIGIFGGNQVFAGIGDAGNVDGGATASTACRTYGDTSEACKRARDEKLIERASLLDDILRAMYLLIRPIIMISGLAIDNKLVFGESIGLDLYLRKFWTIMMVIAYMGLGVSLLITVYEGLKEGGDNLIKKLKETGKKAALAAILIPLSWFLVQQLVNLSTLMTFSVGALPLYVGATNKPDCAGKDGNNNALCTSLLQTHTRFNLTEVFGGDWKSLALYSTRDPDTDKVSAIYLQCPIVQSEINYDQYDKMMKGVLGTDATYAGLRSIATGMILEQGKTLSTASLSSALEKGRDYCVIKSNTLFKLDKKNVKLFTGDYNKGIVDASDVLKGESNIKIYSILELNKSAIGPLYAIYGSILDFGSIGSTTANNPYPAAALIETILKAFQGFMLFIPLVGFAIVMIVRIGYLRVIIGFSPLIVLVNTVFKDGDAAKKVKDIKYFGNLGETLNWVQIAKLIMQPTIVMFALSIGLIFLAIIHQSLNLNKEAMDYYTFGIQMETNATNQSCFDILNLQTVCLDGPGLGYGLGILSDLFNRGILNIIGIMVVRGLFFMALKSNKITGAVAESVEKIAENYVGTREIIPIGDKKVGFMAAQKGIQDTIETITKTDGSKQYENIVKPETERFADTFAGRKNQMNAAVTSDMEKDKKEKEAKGEVFNDVGAITKAVDAVQKNSSYSLSDIDTNKGFNGNQELIEALTTKSNKDGYYHADSGSKKYSEIKSILDGKKVGIASQDWKKYSDAMGSFYKSNKTNTIDASDGKILITKNRLGKEGIIKFTVDNKDVLTEVQHVSADILSYKGKDVSTIKELEDFVGKFNSLGITQPDQYWNEFAPNNISNSLTTGGDISLLDEKKNAVTYNLKLNEGKVTATKK